MEFEIDEDDEDITQEHCWSVCSAYFSEKGLVRQQLDSFDDFCRLMMQEIVEDSRDIMVKPNNQFHAEDDDVQDCQFIVQFGSLTMCAPVFVEIGSRVKPLFPMQARLRKLT
jgi:DNA-directed RNA polymerase II subunit RPB2|tara:strand:- start:19 stop:354 length:336 start_codon:yes stop_codon:yes gene_type:complete